MVVTTWKKISQRFHVRIDQHVTKVLKSWFDGRSEKQTKKYFAAIRQHLLDNPECAKNNKIENFFSFSESRELFSTAYS